MSAGEHLRVLLATDGSTSASDAVGFVADSGLFRESQIRVLSIGDPGMPWWVGVTPVDGATSIDLYAEEAQAMEHRAREVANEAAERLGDLHIADIVAEFRTIRAATLSLFGSFDDESLRRVGTARGLSFSTRGMVWVTVGHARHHLDVLRERYGIA